MSDRSIRRGRHRPVFLRIKNTVRSWPIYGRKAFKRIDRTAIEMVRSWMCALSVNVRSYLRGARRLLVRRPVSAVYTHIFAEIVDQTRRSRKLRLAVVATASNLFALMVRGCSGHCYRSPKKNAEPFSPAYYFHIFSVVFWRCVQQYSRRPANSGRNGANREQNWNCQLARNVGIAKSR